MFSSRKIKKNTLVVRIVRIRIVIDRRHLVTKHKQHLVVERNVRIIIFCILSICKYHHESSEDPTGAFCSCMICVRVIHSPIYFLFPSSNCSHNKIPSLSLILCTYLIVYISYVCVISLSMYMRRFCNTVFGS